MNYPSSSSPISPGILLGLVPSVVLASDTIGDGSVRRLISVLALSRRLRAFGPDQCVVLGNGSESAFSKPCGAGLLRRSRIVCKRRSITYVNSPCGGCVFEGSSKGDVEDVRDRGVGSAGMSVSGLFDDLASEVS